MPASLRKVLTYRAEHPVRAHQLFGFGEAELANFGEFVTVADEDVGSVGRLGGHVDHGASGMAR
jgi:hypothetical protein